MQPVRRISLNRRSSPNFLLASTDNALVSMLGPLLSAAGAHVDVASSANAALALAATPVHHGLVLLDANLPGMEMGRLLAAMRQCAAQSPIIVISDTVHAKLLERLGEGFVGDIVPRTTDPAFWRVRIETALRNHHAVRELEQLRESLALNARYDRLTGVYNREGILSVLFRETDRAQRMKSSLSIVLFDIDDFGHWNSRLGAPVCDGLLGQVAERTSRLLRSYDLLGRVGKDEFLVAMPGCGSVNAAMLAERLRAEVFFPAFQSADKCIRLSACFGISSSRGRSPLVVLREAEQALARARAAGPELIECFGELPETAPAPVLYSLPAAGDELLAW
jgi:two-component system, cell cycle response regulator